MDPPSYVSESMRALDLLRAFLTRRQGMAVIVDEYGGTEGVVTLADIVEEIVGDALPSGEEDLYIEPLDDDRLLVGGHARLDDTPRGSTRSTGSFSIASVICRRSAPCSSCRRASS